ncbi:MAG: hypothetical protein MZV65_17190 [Chromatiales bacterium]|nr:hypothetical protein [Chromatiales bacterium]
MVTLTEAETVAGIMAPIKVKDGMVWVGGAKVDHHRHPGVQRRHPRHRHGDAPAGQVTRSGITQARLGRSAHRRPAEFRLPDRLPGSTRRCSDHVRPQRPDDGRRDQRRRRDARHDITVEVAAGSRSLLVLAGSPGMGPGGHVLTVDEDGGDPRLRWLSGHAGSSVHHPSTPPARPPPSARD